MPSGFRFPGGESFPEMHGRIVGTLTLVVFRIPTGMRAWIEDVVVDAGVRGRGVGEALSQAALTRAAAAGVDAKSCLADNDGYSFFAKLGDLVKTGPTLTNVNDFRAILIADNGAGNS